MLWVYELDQKRFYTDFFFAVFLSYIPLIQLKILCDLYLRSPYQNQNASGLYIFHSIDSICGTFLSFEGEECM